MKFPRPNKRRRHTPAVGGRTNGPGSEGNMLERWSVRRQSCPRRPWRLLRKTQQGKNTHRREVPGAVFIFGPEWDPSAIFILMMMMTAAMMMMVVVIMTPAKEVEIGCARLNEACCVKAAPVGVLRSLI